MADRRPFEEKYSDLSKRWAIDEKLTNYIIRRYTKKLEEEISLLKNNEIELPRYYRDRRSDEEYVYDLIDGWLVEDIVCDAWLKNKIESENPNVIVRHMGTNRDRTLQKYNPRLITTDPDFIYESNGEEVKVELQMARQSRKEGYDMKDSKVKRAVKDSNLFLWVIIPEDAYFFCDPVSDLKNVEPIVNHLWGGKLVYRLDPNRLKKIGLSKMINPLPGKYCKILKLR